VRPETVTEALDWIRWYVQCLEDAEEGNPVYGLTESEAAYEAALSWLAARCA
jgi:hypothetical protein